MVHEFDGIHTKFGDGRDLDKRHISIALSDILSTGSKFLFINVESKDSRHLHEQAKKMTQKH